MGLVKEIAKKIGASDVIGDEDIAKVSIIGLGMRNHAGIAYKMFQTLAKENINISMISTSEIKISCIIKEKYTELAIRALHDSFGLGNENKSFSSNRQIGLSVLIITLLFGHVIRFFYSSQGVLGTLKVENDFLL